MSFYPAVKNSCENFISTVEKAYASVVFAVFDVSPLENWYNNVFLPCLQAGLLLPTFCLGNSDILVSHFCLHI
jgi:hypothetical protein